MKATLKSIAAFAILATLATGCASISLEGDGSGAARPDYLVSQMEDGSHGK